MKKLVCLLLLSVLLTGCAARQPVSENMLHLYFPTELSQTCGGDAICSVDIKWDELPQDDRQAQAQAVIMYLLKGTPLHRSPIPSGTMLNACDISGGVVNIDFSYAYSQLSGMDLTIADYCITLSLTQLPNIYGVRITVGGKELAYRDTSLLLAGSVLLSSTDDVVRSLAATLYFPDSSGELVQESRLLTLYEGESRVGVIVNALLAGPEDPNLLPLLPSDFDILSVRLDGGICYLNLSGENEVLLPADRVQQMQLLRGIVYSLCSLEGVDSVQFLIDGEYSKPFGLLHTELQDVWTLQRISTEEA